jgi:hypothetical protein
LIQDQLCDLLLAGIVHINLEESVVTCGIGDCIGIFLTAVPAGDLR